MSRGLFITFEGSEGCGKSTQTALLRSRLETEGHTCLLVREPGGTEAGECIRDLLQHSKEGHTLCNEAELLLFAASRAQLVREVIRPALENSTFVIADRFLDSTTVYQGFGRGLDLVDVSEINLFAVGHTMPDVTILLDMDAAEGHSRALSRANGKADRMEQQPIEFFEKVRQGYLQIAREDPHRLHVLDGNLPAEELAEQIWNIVTQKLSHL